MNIESILILFGSLVGAIFYLKNQSNKNKRDAIMGQTEGQDKILQENQAAAKAKIQMADDTIDELAQERERLRKAYENKTRDERADDWNKK